MKWDILSDAFSSKIPRLLYIKRLQIVTKLRRAQRKLSHNVRRQQENPKNSKSHKNPQSRRKEVDEVKPKYGKKNERNETCCAKRKSIRKMVNVLKWTREETRKWKCESFQKGKRNSRRYILVFFVLIILSIYSNSCSFHEL